MMNNFDSNQPSFQPSAPLNHQQSQQALDTEATLSDQSDVEKERKKNLLGGRRRRYRPCRGIDLRHHRFVFGIINRAKRKEPLLNNAFF